MNSFSVPKAIQALHYLQEKTDCTNYLKLIKLCFFADRKMVRCYGLPVLFDEYCAMKYGPVCSKTKDILLQDLDFLDTDEENENLISRSIKRLDTRNIEIRDLGNSELSEMDKTFLDFSASTFGKFKPFDLVEITHDYPEWSKYKNAFSERDKVFKMNYIDFFSNPKEMSALDKFLGFDPYEEDTKDLETVKEIFLENYEI